MDTPEHPQIYLITPTEIDPSTFAPQLAAVLDAHPVACVRLALSTKDEVELSRAADALREVTISRDVALVISDHIVLAERLGLDGVHLTDATKSVRNARKTLGADAIVGSFCGASRHDGITAGEAGVDYVAFGPIGASGLGDGAQAEVELFEWWSHMIEVPVVAEGGLDEDAIRKVAPFTDFFGIGDEIWRTEDPLTTLQRFQSLMT